MQLKINLATRSYINTRQLNLAIAVSIALLLLWMFFNVKDIAYNSGEMKRLTTDTTALDTKFKAASKGVPEKEYSTLLLKIGFANSIIEKKSVNWLVLLDNLEAVVPEGVAISAIEPDPKKQILKLSGAATNFNNVRQFVENLESSNFFTTVFLENQAEIKVGQSQKGISFTISCKVDYK
ncbi:PilN domain-containing protein [Geotalea uraniireducens]|uniref:Fimbrial assembly family protein n=1 Tax=Geotalea uraniireducens (strain Rf4) TaxID=351605 RepID=A5GFB1_GEOUR|nr:PilN domain-containing protein [Geotalea uraniireducens]ABQ26116.1 Fimbrial assembly family protein [Geotalea uraniireducens Rf4]